MNHGEVVSRAWKIAWKYKTLWLFLILLSIPAYLISFLQSYLARSTEYGAGMVALTCVFGIISIVLSLAIAVANAIGTIRGIYRAEAEKPEKLTLQEIFAEIPPYFGRVTGFYLLSMLVIGVLVGVAVIPLILTGITGDAGNGFGVIGICLLCLLGPAMILFTFVYNNVIIAMLVDNLTIGAAIQKGWKVIRENAGDYLMIALILFAIGVGWMIVVGGLYFGMMWPMMNELITTEFPNPDMIPSQAPLYAQTPWYLTVFGIVFGLIGLLFSIFIMGIFVLTYLELTGKLKEQEEDDLPPPELETDLETT